LADNRNFECKIIRYLTTYVKGLILMQRQGATGNKEMFTAQGSHLSSTHMPLTLEPKRSVSLTSGVPDTVVKN